MIAETLKYNFKMRQEFNSIISSLYFKQRVLQSHDNYQKSMGWDVPSSTQTKFIKYCDKSGWELHKYLGLYVCLYIDLSICLSVGMFVCLTVCLYIGQFASLFTSLAAWLSGSLSVCLTKLVNDYYNLFSLIYPQNGG